MQPLCPRCGAPLDPSNTAPSRDGPVHPACARPDEPPPVFDPQPSPLTSRDPLVLAPMYGLPPPRRSSVNPLVVLLVTILAIALAIGAWRLLLRP